jgi:hypothetical protein
MTTHSETSASDDVDVAQQGEEPTQQAAEGAETAVNSTAEAAGDAVHSTAGAAEQMNASAAKTASAFSTETAEAFGAARDRLQSLVGSSPLGNPGMLESFKTGGDALGKSVQASYQNAADGMAEFNSKAIEAWRTNAEAAIAHWQNLASVKTLSEAIAINAEHTRRQMETLSTQSRELSALAGRIVRGAVDPLKPRSS